MTVSINDLQSYYNINLLTNQEYVLPFAHWLLVLDTQLKPQLALQIAEQIASWETNRSDANAEYYSKLEPGYRAAHHPMLDTSELNMLRIFMTHDKDMLQLKREIQALSAALPAKVKPNKWTVESAGISGSGPTTKQEAPFECG